jgi:hypothetical protein
MSAMQRNKGRAAEQEVARLIRDRLGLNITRNWERQAAEGGADLTGIPGWAAEVKHAAEFRGSWWPQAVAQAERCNRRPVLFYRVTGHGRGLPIDEKWRAVVRARDLSGEDISPAHTAETSLACWIEFVSETLEVPDVSEAA